MGRADLLKTLRPVGRSWSVGLIGRPPGGGVAHEHSSVATCPEARDQRFTQQYFKRTSLPLRADIGNPQRG
jgi:hypothetical protein